MSYEILYKSTKKEKQFIFQDVANQKNLKAFAIEKDWWL